MKLFKITDAKIKDEAIETRRIIEEGMKTKFWEELKKGLIREIEVGRDTLESPIQVKERGVGSHKVRNDVFWIQYIRGYINALRTVLELPNKLIELGEFAKEMKIRYKE